MALSEHAQEILEQLWVAIEEEGRGNLPAGEARMEGAAASGARGDGVEELVRRGFVERYGDKLTLTAAGYPEAELAVRRHRLAERLMVDVLDTEASLVDEQACRFEHVLTDGVEESICTLLGHPRFCPHGRPIPQGRCCEEHATEIPPLIAPLRDLESGQGGEIAYIRMDKPKRLEKIMAMGVLPGVDVHLDRRFPSYVFQVGHSQFAVDEEIAGDIYVRIRH